MKRGPLPHVVGLVVSSPPARICCLAATLIAAFVFLVLDCPGSAANPVPDPTRCTVLPCDLLNGVVVCPGQPSPIPASEVTVTIRSQSNNPMPDTFVEFQFIPQIEVCPGAQVSGVTDVFGVVSFPLPASGCADEVHAACYVRANGIAIRYYNNVKSPDYDGTGSDHVVNLSDFVDYSLGDRCHDYNNDGIVNLSDLVVFSSAYSPPHYCP